jgi:hypothetical protein
MNRGKIILRNISTSIITLRHEPRSLAYASFV